MKYSLLFVLIFGAFKSFAAVFSLTSPAFEANNMIPKEFTCNGANKSPPFFWHDIPTNTQSLVLVAQDPDAPDGIWTHWIVFNIPPTINNLKTDAPLPEGAALAQNSWGNAKYEGPCPPIGVHRYIFTLYALDNFIELSNNVATHTALDAMTGHVIGSAELTGLYQKQQ